MARARAAEHQRSRSKTALIEEIAHGINKFQEVLAAINDISREGFPYRDAAQSKAELQFRECLRQTFGERSHEFQTYRNFKIRTADKAEVAQTLSVIKDLMHTLEDRKLELQGLKASPKTDQANEALPSNTAHLVLVSPVTPTTTPQVTSPVTVAVAMTTSMGPSSSPLIPQPPPSLPESVNASESSPMPASTLPPTPPPSPTPTLIPIAVASQPPPPSVAASILSPPPASAAQPTSSVIDRPVEVTHASPSPAAAPVSSSIPPQPPINSPTSVVNDQSMSAGMSPGVVRVSQDPPLDKPSISVSGTPLVESALDSALDQDPLQLIRKVCHRFHAVARHLRLRRDYRPTLEVDDDYDLQDLLCALLKVEFDEVATEEWTPPYTGGAPRTTLLVNRDQIAVVSKKTRPGLTTKELVDQVAADSACYRDQGRCSTLFCFVYDPEGRIGSPKRLETTLTSVNEHCRIEVLVAPK